ncbi:MAG: phosphoribosylanthranilate isomerase [Nitrospirota bacterium]
MVKVKICGITNIEDAFAAIEYGADALGFVFFRKSPRYLEIKEAKEIIEKLPPFITTVGVFVDESIKEIERVADHCSLNIIQLHGNEPHETCNSLTCRIIKSFRIRDWDSLEPIAKYRVCAYLLDTYTEDNLGGTGQVFNWDIAREAKRMGRIILAGGLNPDNVEMAVKHVMPYAVDVSSGVEMKKNKRKKDHARMRLFIEVAKGLWRIEYKRKKEI